jgi:hypothetical protein
MMMIPKAKSPSPLRGEGKGEGKSLMELLCKNL